MKPLPTGLAALVFLCFSAFALFGQENVKPLPKWVKTANGKQAFIDQGQHDPRLKGYLTPPGIRVEIAAEFPTVVHPLGMTFGDDGTLYALEWLPGDAKDVVETVTYKDGTTRSFARQQKPIKDVVKVLRDTKGNGVYDEARVLLEAEAPSGILVYDGFLYLAGRGSVQRYRLADLNARPPVVKPEIVAQGFGGSGHYQVSGLSVSLNGWLFITAGNDDHHVEGSDGSRATVLRSGAVFRCRPDGSRLHVFSQGYVNPYRDVVFDAAGNAFHADNDAQASGRFAGCRLLHVAEDSDFGYRRLAGVKLPQPDPLRAALFGELPGRLPPLHRTGRGAPSGLLIYNDSQFPPAYRGLLTYPDVQRQTVRAFQLAHHGATFGIVTEFELLKSADPHFRPCQMVVGPDGAMYVCDWRGNEKLTADGKHGRLYRLRWAGTEEEPALPLRSLDSWAQLAPTNKDKLLGSFEDLLQKMGAPDATVRQRAAQEIVRRVRPGSNDGWFAEAATVRALLLKKLEDLEQPLSRRLACLGGVQALWNEDDVRNAFLRLLDDGEPDVRRLAAEGLGLNCKPGDAVADAVLLQKLGDDDLAARRAIVLAMGRIGGPSAPDALLNTFKANQENDLYLEDAILRALERLGKPGIDKLVEMAQSGVQKDFDKVVIAFAKLRTRPAAEAIPTLLAYPHLTIPQRVSLIRSYGNYLLEPPLAPAPVLKFLERHKDEAGEVKLAALEVLTLGGPVQNDQVDALALDLLSFPFRAAVIEAIARGRLVKTAPGLGKLLAEDKAETPPQETLALLRTLRLLDDRSQVPAVKQFLEKTKEGALREEAQRTLKALEAPDGK